MIFSLLTGFAALSLVSGALMAILSDGSLRRMASMAVGLMMLLYWAGSIASLLDAFPASFPLGPPLTILANTGVSLSCAEEDFYAETEASP